MATTTASTKTTENGDDTAGSSSSSSSSAMSFNFIWNAIVVPIMIAMAYNYGKQSGIAEFEQKTSAMQKNDATDHQVAEQVEEEYVPVRKLREFRRVDARIDPRPQDNVVRSDIVNRRALDQRIAKLRNAIEVNPTDIKSLMELGNNLSLRDSTFGEGGVNMEESIWCYERAIVVLEDMTRSAKLMGNKNPELINTLETANCMSHYYLSLAFNSLDMYEYSMIEFDKALKYKCADDEYKNLLKRRGDALIVMGKYKEAMNDFLTAFEYNRDYFFKECFIGVIRILEADESSVEGGWKWALQVIDENFAVYQSFFNQAPVGSKQKDDYAHVLQKMKLLQFTFYDKKTESFDEAWKLLEESQQYKLKYTITDTQSEIIRNVSNKQMFTYEHVKQLEGKGSPSRLPIYIVGFPRSGTTLLERVLDAHPQIAGLGENSAIHGAINTIRDNMLKSLKTKDDATIRTSLNEMADEILDMMLYRWDAVKNSRKISADADDKKSAEPLRLVDKLNTNNRNVGYIHALFPHALIIHVVRNPMDSVFSSYKHDFNVVYTNQDGSTKNLDNMCKPESLATSYKAYRESMRLWDEVLPKGRIFHIRYEEMVDDLESVAKAVIKAAGLEWHDSILDFHKKKQAVNTFSSTQVRKGIYKSGIDAWKKYETQLQPIKTLLGPYAVSDVTTSMDYTAPVYD